MAGQPCDHNHLTYQLKFLPDTVNLGLNLKTVSSLISSLICICCKHAGLETAHSFKNSAAYVANWLTALKNDERFIVSAAGKADKAVSFILGA